MSNPHSPLCINVGFLLNQPVGVFRDIPVGYDHLDAGEDARLEKFTGSIRITRARRGLLFSLHAQAFIREECVNCLTDFLQPLEITFDELYAFDERSMTDSGLIIPEDLDVDLTPVVREYALLEVPIRPLCREDCKGLCPVCGENLNAHSCEHQEAIEEDLTPREENIKPETSLEKAMKKAMGQFPSA